MSKERRINLRVENDLYERLDRKRFNEKTSFQAVGIALFVDWLQGKRKSVVPDLNEDFTAEEIQWIRALRKFLKQNPDPAVKTILESILRPSLPKKSNRLTA